MITPNTHPIFVHFTIGLNITAIIIFCLHRVLPHQKQFQREWLITAYWSLWIGTLITTLTVITGIHAFYTTAHDKIASSIIKLHGGLAVLLFIMLWGYSGWSIKSYLKKTAPSLLFITSGIILAILITVIGKLGGELVFKYQVGVNEKPLPTTQVSPHTKQPIALHLKTS